MTVALHPARVWSAEDGVREGLSVLVDGDRIAKVAPRHALGVVVQDIELPGCTLLPGLMDLHSHLFLHPYDETPWDDQVLKEPEAYRTVRAVNHARATLAAGFTALRDLGTEGAGYADVALKRAIAEGLERSGRRAERVAARRGGPRRERRPLPRRGIASNKVSARQRAGLTKSARDRSPKGRDREAGSARESPAARSAVRQSVHGEDYCGRSDASAAGGFSSPSVSRQPRA
ncbi:MAG: hypothetical protein WDN03_00940 [Rhizomicrobium sp.]